ncbi:MAG: hypothetical protein QNJ90_10910, partial [Planctomycetota bacterium]|nr:hypothetical protein [Planctomycetota bacterium]
GARADRWLPRPVSDMPDSRLLDVPRQYPVPEDIGMLRADDVRRCERLPTNGNERSGRNRAVARNHAQK